MIFEKVKDIICEQFELEEDSVTPETVITEDLDADSIDLIDLAMTLEDEFQVEVPDEALEKFTTVSDIVDFLDIQ